MSLESRVRETARLLKTFTGETNAELAAAWHCSEPLVRRKLSGARGGGGTISLADVEKWAAHWGITPAELLMGYAALHEAGRLPHALRHAKATGQQRF